MEPALPAEWTTRTRMARGPFEDRVLPTVIGSPQAGGDETSLTERPASDGLVEEGGHRAARPVGHARGDVALALALGDALDDPLGDGELVLQQLGGALAQLLGQRAEAGGRDPVRGAPSPGGDLLGAVPREGLLGLDDLALEVLERGLPRRGRRAVAGDEAPAAGHAGSAASDAAASRQASRSGSTTLRQSRTRRTSPLMLAWISSW